MPIVPTDSCSWLTEVEPDVVLLCCSLKIQHAVQPFCSIGYGRRLNKYMAECMNDLLLTASSLDEGADLSTNGI